MKDTSKRLPVAEQIRKGLEEAIRHARGEITLKTTIYVLPDEPPEIDAPTLVALRDQSRRSAVGRIPPATSSTGPGAPRGLGRRSRVAHREARRSWS